MEVVSKLSEGDECELKVLQAKKDVYSKILEDIQLVLDSASEDRDTEEISEDESLKDNPPYYYLYFAIENNEATEFYLETDVLITQTNISDMNKKISSLSDTSGVDYGASRVYEVPRIDYIFKDGILEKV